MFAEFFFKGGIEAFAPELHRPVVRGSGAVFEGEDFQWCAAAIHHIASAVYHQHPVGFDLHEQRYFHRQLPFGEDRVRRNYPRLEAAKALLDQGAVRSDGDAHEVRGDHGVYWVRPHQGRLQCTCVFEAKYQGSRGPCKHALAVQLFSGRIAPLS